MQTITTLTTLTELVATQCYPLYVRYAGDIEGDLKRGVCRDHVAGTTHDGLSCVRLDGTTPAALLKQTLEYSYFLRQAPDVYRGAYLLAGRQAGRDSDGATLLKDARLVAQLSATWHPFAGGMWSDSRAAAVYCAEQLAVARERLACVSDTSARRMYTREILILERCAEELARGETDLWEAWDRRDIGWGGRDRLAKLVAERGL